MNIKKGLGYLMLIFAVTGLMFLIWFVINGKAAQNHFKILSLVLSVFTLTFSGIGLIKQPVSK